MSTHHKMIKNEPKCEINMTFIQMTKKAINFIKFPLLIAAVIIISSCASIQKRIPPTPKKIQYALPHESCVGIYVRQGLPSFQMDKSHLFKSEKKAYRHSLTDYNLNQTLTQSIMTTLKKDGVKCVTPIYDDGSSGNNLSLFIYQEILLNNLNYMLVLTPGSYVAYLNREDINKDQPHPQMSDAMGVFIDAVIDSAVDSAINSAFGISEDEDNNDEPEISTITLVGYGIFYREQYSIFAFLKPKPFAKLYNGINISLWNDQMHLMASDAVKQAKSLSYSTTWAAEFKKLPANDIVEMKTWLNNTVVPTTNKKIERMLHLQATKP